MAGAKDGDVVAIHYTGRLRDGRIFDTNVDDEPLRVELGTGKLIPGFEQALQGMEPGDTRSFEIPCADAYGDPREELVFEIRKDQLPGAEELTVGQTVTLSQGESEANVRVQVTETTDETVTLDANHPLAGEDLVFQVALVSIDA